MQDRERLVLQTMLNNSEKLQTLKMMPFALSFLGMYTG